MRPVGGSAEPDLRHYLRVLQRRRWVIVLAVFVVVATTGVVSLNQTPVYQATTELLITPRSNTSSLFNQSGAASGDPTRDLQTQIRIITSRAVRDRVTGQLGSAPSVSVAPVGQTNIVQIRASSTIRHQAAQIANAYANAYLGFEQTQALSNLAAAGTQLQSKISDLQKQIDALNAQVAAATASPDPPAQPNNPALVAAAAQAATAHLQAVEANLGPQRDNLVAQQGVFKQRLDQLQVDASVNSGEAQLVTQATDPSSPTSPRPKRSVVLALVVGLMFGVGVSFLLDYLDDSVRSREDVEGAAHGLAALGLIPRVAEWKATGSPQVVSIDQPMSPAAEAYRTLRTSIQFVGLEHAARIIQMTSPSAQEGKTTTLANLGVALAAAGQRVCLCCCDLRRPRIHDFFGMANAVGFTSVVLGQKSVSAAIQQVPGVDRLWLLASGPLPPNPSELLASERAKEVIRSLAAMYDVVLLDCPPVLPVTDAAVVSAVADATILVVSPGDSTRREIGRAVEILRQVDAPLIGTVLNGISSDGSDYYSQYYDYYRHDEARGDSPAGLVEHGASSS